MVRKFYVPDDLQHPSWTGEQPDRVKSTGLTFATLPTEWVVQLTFKRGTDSAVGNGFFVNIPGVPGYHVILTAGHNLIGPDKEESREITIRALTAADDYVVPAGQYYICKSFKDQPVDNDPNDWGVILYPRGLPNLFPARYRDQGMTQTQKDMMEASFGFRFSLRLGHADSLQGQASISGYRDVSPRGEPRVSSGTIIAAYPTQVEYKATTERGISGSVVWIPYRTFPTAIAIHNYGPKYKGAGSRGSRITAELMREVYGFTKGASLGVQLRAHGTPRQVRELPLGGLFLSFPSTFPFARVHLRSGTPVDLLPAQSGGVPMHLMAVSTPSGMRYAAFNIGKREIVLREKIRDDCLFELVSGKPSKQGEETIQIKIPKDMADVEGKEKFQLRVQGTAIREFDGDDAESSEVSFVDAPTSDAWTAFALQR